MRESQQVLEWQAEAIVKIQRANILRALELRCGANAPADVLATVQSSADLTKLSQWFDAALKAASYDEFRTAMES